MLGITQQTTNKFLEKNYSFLLDQTVPKYMPSDVLGCGYYGCVYTTEDPSIVFKISSDPTEFMFIDVAMDLGEWPEGIVRYYDTAVLKGKYEGRDLFGVWREAAFDVGDVLDITDTEHIMFAFRF